MKLKKTLRPVMASPVARENLAFSSMSSETGSSAQAYWENRCGDSCDPVSGKCYWKCDFYSAFAEDDAQ